MTAPNLHKRHAHILTAEFNSTKKFKAGPDGLYFNVKLETGGAVANVGDAIKLPHATRPKRRRARQPSHTLLVYSGSGID